MITFNLNNLSVIVRANSLLVVDGDKSTLLRSCKDIQDFVIGLFKIRGYVFDPWFYPMPPQLLHHDYKDTKSLCRSVLHWLAILDCATQQNYVLTHYGAKTSDGEVLCAVYEWYNVDTIAKKSLIRLSKLGQYIRRKEPSYIVEII